ncbi:MAG: hypothetical protein WCF48_10390 [Terriglobales bacterium]
MVCAVEQSKAKLCPTFRTTAFTVLLCMGLAGLGGVRVIGGPSAFASPVDAAQESSPESWQKEFDNICAKTEDAMTFSEDELTDLIRRCDSLQPRIEKLDESRKKVYLERLRKCRGLYAYVLDAKKREKK